MLETQASVAPVAVVYVDWKGIAPRYAARFLRSLQRRRAGAAYQLVYVLNDYDEGETPRALARHLRRHPEVMVVRTRKRFPLAITTELAATLPQEKMLLLWSWSELLADNWLAHYLNAFASVPDCGIVGATGSFEAMPGETVFPNMHVRSTAFMVNRVDYAKAGALVALHTHRDEFLFEAGPSSLTRQLLADGKHAVLVGRDGTVYYPEAWAKAGLFRSQQQENLLVSDKQTYLYDRVNLGLRQRIAAQAWGEAAQVEKAGLLRRGWAVLRWRLAV